MQTKLWTLDDWLIVTVSQLSWFHCITTDSPVHESASHGVIFSTDKSNISRSCETGSQTEDRICSVAASSALPPSLLRDTVQDSPTYAHSPQQRCQLWQTVLRAKLFFWGWVRCSVKRVGRMVAGQAGCPWHGTCKAGGRCWRCKYHRCTRVPQGFFGIFYRNILCKNYRTVMVAKQDITARVWLVLTWRFTEKRAGLLYRWTTEQEATVIATSPPSSWGTGTEDGGGSWCLRVAAVSSLCSTVWECLGGSFSA